MPLIEIKFLLTYMENVMIYDEEKAKAKMKKIANELAKKVSKYLHDELQNHSDRLGPGCHIQSAFMVVYVMFGAHAGLLLDYSEGSAKENFIKLIEELLTTVMERSKVRDDSNEQK